MYVNAPCGGINKEGFITFWLSCEPYVTLPQTDIKDSDQLAFESKVRAVIADKAPFTPQTDVKVGAPACGGNPWQYKSQGGSCFIDYYHFYHLLRKAEVWAYTRINSTEAKEISATAWTYTAADVYVNGCRVLENTQPVYKPIKKQGCTLPLKKGVNEIFVRMQVLGARDTRTMFALQLSSSVGLTVVYPDNDKLLTASAQLQGWLNSVYAVDGVLYAAANPPKGVTVNGKPWEKMPMFAPENPEYRYEISVADGEKTYTRSICLMENLPSPTVSPEKSRAARAKRLFDAIDGDRLMNQLAMRYIRCKNSPSDETALLGMLDETDKHPDCSDFTLNMLIRLMRTRRLSDAAKARFREVALNYRYWMDEDGTDAMCFWSENHSLLFHSNQYLAGAMYPDEKFLQSGLTGTKLSERGRERCDAWLDSVNEFGFEEFLSSGYAPVTDAALLNIIDFGDDEIAEKARKALNKQLRQFAMHAFNGSVIAPQGRVYGDVITPHLQGMQGVANLNIGGMNDASTGWLCAFATSAFKPEEGLEDLAAQEEDTEYRNGNALITLKKTEDYILTACVSPSSGFTPWDSKAYKTQNPAVTGKFSNLFVKALNERFHGTTNIRPAVYGYQQHLMYAALAADAVSFINHPGDSKEQNSMRPGYWFGNGIMPAITRKGNRLAVIYDIEAKHPIGFTHVFWPAVKFDESFQQGNTLFARRGKGYMALWCSAPLTPYSDVQQGCEYRAEGGKTAYMYTMGSESEYGSFQAFKKQVSANEPTFDKATLTLTQGDIELKYVPCEDDTQYVN